MQTRILRTIASLAVACSVSAPGLAVDDLCSAPPPGAERTVTYRVDIGGVPAGLFVETVEFRSGTVVIEERLDLALRRGGSTLEIESVERFVEDADGAPIEAGLRQVLGPEPTVRSYRFADGELQRTEGDRPPVTEPLASDWLTPTAAHRRRAEAVRAATAARAARLQSTAEHAPAAGTSADGDPGRLVLPIFDEESGLRIEQTYVLEALDEPLALGEALCSTSRWRQTSSLTPETPATVWMSPGGTILRTETELLGRPLVFERVVGGVAPPSAAGAPEMLVDTLIVPDRPIDAPRSQRRMRYRLRVEGVRAELPSTGWQRARQEAEGIVVDIDLDAPPVPAPPPGPDALADSTLIDHRAPAVRDLARRRPAPADARLPERAEHWRRVVAETLEEKNLDTLFARASAVAASGSGDCTEHAVLLAALLRADGVPARLAIGVVYAEAFAERPDVFAYHMWTQAYLDGAWRDLDATLSADVAFDATHLTFATTEAPAGGMPLAELVQVAPWIGRTQLDVLSIVDDESAGAI
ncbi:MAG: transglutaminase domain-containing protein [Acidobacteriota bacterium]